MLCFIGKDKTNILQTILLQSLRNPLLQILKLVYLEAILRETVEGWFQKVQVFLELSGGGGGARVQERVRKVMLILTKLPSPSPRGCVTFLPRY